ncbi:MAG: 6-hydroxycyclohex-1-ene-1-carbonyl-CoA dehydrogenase [Candidatus Eisenbacteria bacterium]
MSDGTLAYVLETPAAPLVAREMALPVPGPGEAIVEVLACGLCHTDLGFADGSVRPGKALPLVLGHEVVGTVVATGPEVTLPIGTRVIVPAVLPCGRCDFCRAGRGNACPQQKMPGNDIDGGFATHVRVPAHPLVPLDGMPPGFDARLFSVVADAVSTAYQAVRRAGLESGDAVFVVGAGGVGGFVTQIARALGARVAVCDVSPERLRQAAAVGAEHTCDVRDRAPQDVRKELHALARTWQVPSLRWRIFECSGTPAGQLLAYGLLARAATLLQVGYTPKPVEVRLSNLMAFDATVHGSWGCPPEAYPDVLRLIAAGQVVLEPFVEHAPMSSLNELLDALAHHRLERRMILDPRR